MSKAHCGICNNETSTFICRGCSSDFCFDHLKDHRQMLQERYHDIQNEYNLFKKIVNEQKKDSNKRHLIKQIDQWEEESINIIKQTANQYRYKLINYTNKFITLLEDRLNETIESIKVLHEINENDLKLLSEKLTKLKEELDQPPNVTIKQQPSASFIKEIFVTIPMSLDTKWKQIGLTIAGGKNEQNQSYQFAHPYSICIVDDGSKDNDQTIYIIDRDNHRIVQWKVNGTNDHIIAGGKGKGNQTNQLNLPTDMIFNKQDNVLIIADYGNRRVLRWSRQNNIEHGEIMLSNIDCYGLAMDKDGSLYVTDYKKNEVRRWKRGEKKGILVAGGNGKGDQVNQLNYPTYVFVDENESLYISDKDNHRVMKWIKDANEGIVVAGGNGQGKTLKELSEPQGVIVDPFGQIYVADLNNHRIMRWCEGDKRGSLVIRGHKRGQEINQLKCPRGLSMDREGNLYVADSNNHRIQKFMIDFD